MNYNQVKECLKDCKPFKHGQSMSGKIEGVKYIVYSYTTPIAQYNFVTKSIWITFTKYSHTTTRQTNLCKAYLAHNLIGSRTL